MFGGGRVVSVGGGGGGTGGTVGVSSSTTGEAAAGHAVESRRLFHARDLSTLGGTVREYYHPEIKVEKTVTFSSVRIQFTNTF